MTIDAKLVSALQQPTNLVFFGFMLVLALIDLATYFWKSGKHHRNFKGEIVGLGILGTFFGIFIGLQTFEPKNIQESIPPLLDGLKTAFLTSIAGMGISMLLTVLQTIVRTGAVIRADNPLQALVQDLLAATLKANQESSANGAALLEQIRNGRMEQRDEALKVRQVFESSFSIMNASLQEALDKLSEGASKEIIKALEDVIKDFNENLTQQFGENFKQLNAACLKLVEWQDNYKVIIEQVEAALKQSVTAIEATDKTLHAIAEKNSDFERLCNRLGDVISTSDRQTQELNEHLAQQRALAEQVKALVSMVRVSIDAANEQLKTASERTEHAITSTFERTERGIKASMESVTQTFSDQCNTFAGNLRETKQGLDELTTKIQGSLTAQSASLAALTTRTTEMTDKTREELAASLRQLDNVLSSLTAKFGATYKGFLDSIERLMPK